MKIARFVESRHLLVLLVSIGLLERILWNVLRPGLGASGEAMRVALAVGSGRGIADAYRLGQGPTAHLLPISPGFAGLIYRLLGVGSMPAEIVLATWSIGLAMATYLVLFRTFERLGTPGWARIAGLAFACIAPTYLGQEAVDFRVWDGGLAACLAALFLSLLTAALEERELGLRQSALRSTRRGAAAAVCALALFVNPPLGAALMLCAGVFAWRELSIRESALPAAVAAGVLAALVTPWTLRNERVLHATIPFRSDAGLELALANYSTALDSTDRRQQFLNRLQTIHPSFNRTAYRSVKAEGELAYSRRVGARAARWMEGHPAEAAGLILLHMRQSLAPQAWQFDVFGKRLSPPLRAALADLAGVCGLIALALAVAARRSGWGYLALLIGSWVALTSPLQPVPRYTYLVYPFLVFCAADLLAQGRAALARARALRSRQPDRRDRSPARSVREAQPSTVRLDDLSAEGKPEACARGLGREERQ